VSGIVSCHADTIAGSGSVAFEITGLVNCGAANGALLGVSALVGSATNETNTGNNVAAATATVSNAAPTITDAAPSLTELPFRANHFVPVTVSYNATDACAVTTSLSVTSSDPVTGDGQGIAGHTSPDWIVVNEHEVMLRSERLPTSAERVYTITITAIDAAGQVATEDVTVTVPR
jgi:hypothetical protein